MFNDVHVTVTFYNNLDGCECSNKTNHKTGQGNCNNIWTNGFWCYVIQPSNCSDLTESESYPGKQWSYEACKIDNG